MTASNDLESLSQADCASEVTHRPARNQAAITEPHKYQAPGTTTRAQGDDKAADQDRAVLAAAEGSPAQHQGAARDFSRATDKDTASRAETCRASSATTKETERKLDPDTAKVDNNNGVRDGKPKGRSAAQARLPPANGPPRQRWVSAVHLGQHQYSQFLQAEHQPYQQILPMSYQPVQVAGPQQHPYNYLHQQAAPQPGFYSQPLVSWAACAAPDASTVREPHQLYAPAIVLQHQAPHPACALVPGYNQQQATLVTGNFGPAPILPVANYLPAPAFYTGHQHLFGQPPQHQHTAPPVLVPPQSQRPPLPTSPSANSNRTLTQSDDVHDLAPVSRSPSVVSLSSDSDTADMSRVIVDSDTVTISRELAGRVGKAVPPPQLDPCGKAADAAEHSERAAALNDETSTTQSNRATSHQKPAATMITATTKPTPGVKLIHRSDIDDGSKNETRRERQKQPRESESTGDKAEADETRQEEQKKAVAPLGGEDQHARAHVRPFATATAAAEVPSTQDQATGRLAADCESSPSLAEFRRQVDCSPTNFICDRSTVTTTTTTIDEAQSANALMVVKIGEDVPTQPKNTEYTGPDCQPAESLDTTTQTHTLVHNAGHELDSTTATRGPQPQDDAPPQLSPTQTGHISINGTTFYHINPALFRVGLPPLLPPATPPPHSLVQEHQSDMYQLTNKTPMNYIAPAHYYQLANDYTHNPMLTLPPNRMAGDCYYYWPAATTTRSFDLVQTTGLMGSKQQQRHLYSSAACGLDQRPSESHHQHLMFPKPFQFDPSYTCVNQQPAFVAQSPQMSHASSQASIAPPPVITATVPVTTTAVANNNSVPGPPPAPNLTQPVASSSIAPAQAPCGNGVSQLKLGYNLIPLLPISAIPTRVRQAYGMDKVWQDEFEQLFSQFISQVVWTLVEVETNPNIRSSSRLVAYKGRYIVRVDNPMAGRPDGVCSAASSANQDDRNTAELEPVCDDEDDSSSWGAGPEETDNCCCRADDSDGVRINRGDDDSPGRLVRSNSGESDCDSGAVLNSTSGSSETTSQDSSSSSELGSSRSPASTSPCHMAGSHREATPTPAPASRQTGREEPDSGMSSTKAQSGRKFPLKFRMFIDSAKVRFCCDSCGHGWTSMKGRVVFWYELFELIDGQVSCAAHGAPAGVSNLIGYCAYKLFGQQCDICKIENRFERPMWYPEEVTKVLCNFFNKIGQVYFGFRMPAIDKQRRAGKPKTSHNSLLCQACHDGVCTDRK